MWFLAAGHIAEELMLPGRTWECKDDIEAHCIQRGRKPALPPIQKHLQQTQRLA
jgi:hypothetical protein